MILDKEEGILLGYEIYPGSISDAVTLDNIMKKNEVHGVKDFILIIDQVFFSISNIELLLNSSIDFFFPERYKNVEKLISSMVKEI